MLTTEGMRLEFVCLHDAWYGEATLDHTRHVAEIAVCDRLIDDGVDWEFLVRWYDLDATPRHMKRRGPLHPQISFFSDTWQVFLDLRIQGLLATLGDLGDDPIQPDEFKQLLIDQGFHDATPYVREDG